MKPVLEQAVVIHRSLVFFDNRFKNVVETIEAVVDRANELSDDGFVVSIAALEQRLNVVFDGIGV